MNQKEFNMDIDDNLERAKKLTASWPEWKRKYLITKYSESAQKKGASEKQGNPQSSDDIQGKPREH